MPTPAIKKLKEEFIENNNEIENNLEFMNKPENAHSRVGGEINNNVRRHKNKEIEKEILIRQHQHKETAEEIFKELDKQLEYELSYCLEAYEKIKKRFLG